MRRAAIAWCLSCAAVACSLDFAQFATPGDGGAASAQDGGGTQDGTLPAEASGAGEDGSGGGGSDAPVGGQDAGDASVPLDAGPGNVDSGPDACVSSCTGTAAKCGTGCTQTFNTCTAGCPMGNSGKSCRTTCQTQETTCKQGCVSKCDTCTTNAGCGDPSACTAAVP